MTQPEFTEPSPEFEEQLLNFDFDTDIFGQLVDGVNKDVNKEFNESFRLLREQIARVELLGVDDETRQSYHLQYVDDRNRKVIYFCATAFYGVGRTYRAIVNLRTNNIDGSSLLSIQDFLVSNFDDAVTVQETEFWQSSEGKSYNETAEIGPILRLQPDKLLILRGRNYGLTLPEMQENDPLKIRIERSNCASNLTNLLATLNNDSLESLDPTLSVEEKWI